MSQGVGYDARMNTSNMKAGEWILKPLSPAHGDEVRARELLESLRWPAGPVCPHCKNSGAQRISKLAAQTTRQRACAKPSIFAAPAGSNSA